MKFLEAGSGTQCVNELLEAVENLLTKLRTVPLGEQLHAYSRIDALCIETLRGFHGDASVRNILEGVLVVIEHAQDAEIARQRALPSVEECRRVTHLGLAYTRDARTWPGVPTPAEVRAQHE